MRNHIIRFNDVYKEYRLDREVVFSALKKINLTINEGEFAAIIGPSGSGKSTLMHVIGLLDKPTKGQVFVEGKEISKMKDSQLSSLRNQFVGFVFQQFNLINKLTVIENIVLPTIYATEPLAFDPKDKALYLIRRFGLEEKAYSYPHKISGGQQQRVAIARALVMDPKLILADEPTGNLDTKTGAEIIKLLIELNIKDKRTLIVVTHDSEIASKAKRIIKIKDGEIVKNV